MATILPLTGKYYGTEFELKDGATINVWVGGGLKNWTVSEREIEQGWNEDCGYDHVESTRDYEIAQIIAKALSENGY
jgi:hypothetical protein